MSPDHALFLEMARDRLGLAMEEPNERLGTPEKCRDALKEAGFASVEARGARKDLGAEALVADRSTPSPLQLYEESGILPQKGGDDLAAYSERAWEQCSGSPFWPIAQVAPPDLLEPFKRDFMAAVQERAKDRLSPDGKEVVNPFTTFFVIAKV